MQINTDSGSNLNVEPTITQPFPPDTPETQAVPAGGYTPTQVQVLVEQAAASPPVTPVYPVAQLVPPEVQPGGGEGRTTESVPYKVLHGAAAVDQLYASADLYGIDVLASAANAIHEGASGGIGDTGTAYGPWQIHATDGRLSQFSGLPRYSPTVNAWAWSSDGFDYAHRSMKDGGASGLTGHAAVHAIVYGFERPADKVGAERTRTAEYDTLRGLGSDLRAYLIAAFQGPAVAGTAAGPSGTTVIVPPANVTPPAGLNASWNHLASLVLSNPAKRHAAVKALNSRLIGVFK